MKRIIAIIGITSMLCGCSMEVTNNTISDFHETIASAPELNTTLSCEKRYLTEISSERMICVEVPAFEDENLDQAVCDYVTQKLEKITDRKLHLTPSEDKITTSDFSYTDLQIDLEMTSCHSIGKQRSIVLEGILNYKTAAHPMDLLFSLNLDIETGERVWFKDAYVIDSSLYEAFSITAQEGIIAAAGEWPEDWGHFEEEICSYAAFEDGLRSETEFSWYPTDYGIVISYPVPFSLGNHLEVTIPFDKLQSVGR